MHDLLSSPGIVALAAALVAVAAAVLAGITSFRLRKVQRAQSVVLGDRGERDLVAHAEAMQSEFKLTADLVEELLQRLDAHANETKRRLDGSICHSAIVRYDAYGEMSGRQSHSIVLLDDRKTGIVLSSIHHRDQARLYVKQVREGVPDIELSPEELQAARLALGAEPQPAEHNGRGEQAAPRSVNA